MTADMFGAQANDDKEHQGHFADIHGLSLYYEIHGVGEPLVLLGGGFMTIEAMSQVLAPLAKTRQVIAIELQGHGHTLDIDRPLSYELMADDVAALIERLDIAPADIFGYSLGGGVALQLTIRQPELTRKLVLASAPFKREGWYPEVLAGMAEISPETVPIAPPTVANKVKQLLATDYDWTDQVSAMNVPVLIVIGDADSVRTAHAIEMFCLLGGGKNDGASMGRPPSQLAVIPDSTHFTLLNHTKLVIPMIEAFLDAPTSDQ